ncbi:MAG: PKD domain-containing protein, partial [bacterium]|nr:PKD domain-containing protein [bacterium]
AVFTAANTNGPSPLAVTFTDASIGTITLHEWDFDNDGVIDSNVQNPINTYLAAGKFSVALTVSNAVNSSTQTEIELVIVDELKASFTASSNAITSGTNVVFTDTSTGNPTAWAWDLDGDGMVDSNVQNPNFTYTAPGVVTVTLTASNAAFSGEVATNTIEVDTIPMLPYYRTFSNSGQTRGYWFVTPVGFSITGLQVPDEQGSGLQNVAVAKIAGTTTTTYDTMFEAFAAPASQVLPTSISFEAGDTVYVLGAAGPLTRLANSYSAASGPSTVLGQPITLARATYDNIVTSPISAGGQTLGLSTSGNIARTYTVVSDATGVDYGTASDNGNNLGAPELTTKTLPVVGTTAELT